MNNLKEFVKLVQDNPELPVICKVESDIVQDDGYAWWTASIGGAEIDHYWENCERAYFKKHDLEDIEAQMEDEYWGFMPKEAVKIEVAERLKAIPWEKVIVLDIRT